LLLEIDALKNEKNELSQKILLLKENRGNVQEKIAYISAQTELVKIEEKLETLELERQNLQARLDNLNETTIIKEPGFLKNPIKPNKKLNVLIGGVIGLLTFLLIAFFTEYLQSVRERERDT
jgi:uncharacterized protein involved in exopolysaccharide biosynthesis